MNEQQMPVAKSSTAPDTADGSGVEVATIQDACSTAGKVLSTVLLPRPHMLDVKQTPVKPRRMPEFWQREHTVHELRQVAQVRARPYVVRGRDHETAFMAERVQSMPLPVQLISGPPGAGKTSLLRNVQRYAAAQGCHVIHLRHSAFDSHALLADAIRNVTHPNQRTPVAATINAGESSEGNVVVAARGASVGTSHTHSVDEAWQWENAILEIARSGVHRGLMITLDEIQLLGSEPEGTELYKRIRAFLQFMHNEGIEDDHDPPARMMLVCAGLLNAEDTLKHYDLTRVEGKDILRLGPLSDVATRQIILDHMTARVEEGGQLPQLPEPILTRLVDLCGGYPHHISHAAQNAQRQAMVTRMEGRVAMTEAELETIVEATAEAKEKHYGNRVQEETDQSIAQPVQIIAQATECWGDQLPVESTIKLLNAIDQSRGVASGSLLTDVIAKGILEHRRPGVSFPTLRPNQDRRPHYVFPIHSMQTWLLQELDNSPNAEAVRADNLRIIEGCGHVIRDGERIPAWEWDDTQSLPWLAPMPPDETFRPQKSLPVVPNAPAHTPGHADSLLAEGVVETATVVRKEMEPRVRRWWRDFKHWVERRLH